MGAWSYYFFCKLLLVAGGYLQAHVPTNLAFALFTALPLQSRGARVLKQAVAIPVGIALLYYDTWLPPLTRLRDQAEGLSEFSAAYLGELALRFIDLRVVLALVALSAVLWLLAHRLRLGTLAVLGIVVSACWTPASHPPRSPDTVAGNAGIVGMTPGDTLDAFYRRENVRKVLFPTPADEALPYDIVLLHICSLAWDDLDAVGLRGHPLLQRLDLRFSRFNAAASYSGPAAIRVLRSACGQPAHDALYQTPDPDCLLMNRLTQSGFETQLAMNHDGKFGDFLSKDLRVHGGLKAPLYPLEGTPVILRAFDGSAIHDDYAVLSHWWRQRQTLPAARVALYYNTASLHDGNSVPGGGRLSTLDSYRQRATRLLDGLNRFFDDVQADGRRVVVALVPEHGANVRGDRMQISGLREIPSPAITHVPAGIALLGRTTPDAPVHRDRPSSHLAVAQLLSQFIAQNPYAADAPGLLDYADTLAVTPMVAENDGVVVMQQDERWWLRSPERDWTEYQP